MTQSHTTGSDEQMSEETKVYNPWREFIENVISGDNYFRTSEWHDLLEDLDRLYAIEASRQSPAAEAVVPTEIAAEAAKLAPILRDMIEHSGEEQGVDIYADDYTAPDGDVYVARAVQLLQEIALAPNQPAAIEPVAAQAMTDEQIDSLMPADVQRSAECHKTRWRQFARALLASQPAPATGAQGVEYPYTALAEIAELVGHDTSKGFRANLVESVRAALASAQPIEQATFDASDAIERIQDACEFLEELSATNEDATSTLKRLQSALRIIRLAPQQSTAIDVRELLEAIDRKAEAGLCYYQLGSVRSFHEDIRRMIADHFAKSSPPATEAGEQQ
jgi:hypothetical protein